MSDPTFDMPPSHADRVFQDATKAVDALTAALKDGNNEIRRSAAQALAQIYGSGGGSPNPNPNPNPNPRPRPF